MSLRLYTISTLVALAHAQGVILSAVGDAGQSLPLQIDLTGSDANIINDSEISKNVVNECGRTLLGGNIDIGENTEKQLQAKTVTTVSKGGKLAVTIMQGTADGAGPYSCDLDLSSNGDGTAGQTTLPVTETDNGDGTTSLAVTMPADLACFGASTGNVCTVRCRNAAAAGPFGGCFAVQQSDVTPSVNDPNSIKTAQTMNGIAAQIAQNKLDINTTIAAIDGAGSTEAEQGLALVDSLLDIDSKAAATVPITGANAAAAAAQASGTAAAAVSATSAAAATASTAAASTTNTKGNGNGNGTGGRKHGNGNANGNANANANANANGNGNANFNGNANGAARAGAGFRGQKRSMRWGDRAN